LRIEDSAVTIRLTFHGEAKLLHETSRVFRDRCVSADFCA
jgi:hypothetical protein